jgi:hypothetical protein
MEAAVFRLQSLTPDDDQPASAASAATGTDPAPILDRCATPKRYPDSCD